MTPQIHSGELRGVAVGAALLTLAMVVARVTAPTRYELSLYSGPMVLFWACVGTAMLAATVVAVYGRTALGRGAGIALGWAAAAVISGLPTLRSYYFFGRFDALNHLGTVKDLLAGVSVTETIYPAMHLLTTGLVSVTGLPPRVVLRSLPPVFVLLFALGYSALASRWSAGGVGNTLGGLVAVQLPFLVVVRLPKIQPLPTVFGLLFFPLLLYVLFASLAGARRFTLCLLLLLSAFAFYHPQHALLLALGMCVGNAALWWIGDRSAIGPRFAPPAYTVVLLTVWLTTKPEFRGAVGWVLGGVQSETGVVEGATPSGTGLAEVGGSLPEIAAKVLGPKVMLLGGLAAVALYAYRALDDRTRPPARTAYALSFAVAAGVFVPPFALTSARSQMFRYVAAGTVFALVGLILYVGRWDRRAYSFDVRHVIAVVLVLTAVTSLPIMFKSGYVYQPNDHVPEREVDGYRFVFENGHAEPIRTISAAPFRYRNALYGKERSTDMERLNHRFSGLLGANVTNRDLATTSGTFVVTEYSRARYVDLYGGLGYDSGDFEYVDRGPGVDKVYANGGTAVYVGSRTDNETIHSPRPPVRRVGSEAGADRDSTLVSSS